MRVIRYGSAPSPIFTNKLDGTIRTADQFLDHLPTTVQGIGQDSGSAPMAIRAAGHKVDHSTGKPSAVALRSSELLGTDPEDAPDAQRLLAIRRVGERVVFASVTQAHAVRMGSAAYHPDWPKQYAAIDEAGGIPVTYSELEDRADPKSIYTIEGVAAFVGGIIADLQLQRIREMLPELNPDSERTQPLPALFS